MKLGKLKQKRKPDILDKRKGKKKGFGLGKAFKSVMGGALLAGGAIVFSKLFK